VCYPLGLKVALPLLFRLLGLPLAYRLPRKLFIPSSRVHATLTTFVHYHASSPPATRINTSPDSRSPSICCSCVMIFCPLLSYRIRSTFIEVLGCASKLFHSLLVFFSDRQLCLFGSSMTSLPLYFYLSPFPLVTCLCKHSPSLDPFPSLSTIGFLFVYLVLSLPRPRRSTVLICPFFPFSSVVFSDSPLEFSRVLFLVDPISLAQRLSL